MFDASATPPDVDTLDRTAVMALVASLYAEIVHLRLVVAKLRRMHLGRKSEKLHRPSNNSNSSWKGSKPRLAQPRRPA